MKQNLLSFINKFRLSVVTCFTAAVCGSVVTFALPVSYYADKSKLSDGKWVKVKTTGEGIHEISYETLREWGFTDPSKVNVYGYAATLLASETFETRHPDDIVLSYTHHEGDKIYFFSAGEVTNTLTSLKKVDTKTNYYSNDVYYLLSDRTPDASETLAAVGYSEHPVTVDRHLSLSYVKENIQNPYHGGAYFIGHTLEAGEKYAFQFNVRDMDIDPGSLTDCASVNIGFGAKRYLKDTYMDIELPEGLTASDTDPKEAECVDIYDDNPPAFTLGSTLVSFNTNLADGQYDFKAIHPNESQQFMAVDYAWFLYPRKNRMNDDAQLSMHLYNNYNGNIAIEGAPSVRLFNVTASDKIFAYETVYDSENNTVNATLSRPSGVSSSLDEKLIAFDVALPQKKVEFVGEVANQNLHGENTPDMVIITTDDLLAAAQDLADIHRKHSGIDVLVVEQDKVFNEFSSATPEIMAYRRFVKMFYDRDPDKLKNIILYGRSTWDNRGHVIVKKNNLLVYETTNPYYSASITRCFATDAVLGMVSDSYTANGILRAQQQIAVGRIPASGDAKGFDLNRKIKAHLESVHTAREYGRALIVSDDGDQSLHLGQAEGVAALLQEEHAPISVVRAHNSILPWDNNDAKELRRITIKAFNEGVGLYTYVGHGSFEAFGAERLWTRNFVMQTDYAKAPLGVLATCFAFSIDDDALTIGSEMIEKENGGMIGVIGTGREVYAQHNSPFALAVAREYAKADEKTTMGEIWLRARNSIVATGSTDLCINTMCYNLGGDPSLLVHAPDYNVEITSISASDQSTIEPLEPQTIEGRIIDKNGKPVTDFNGTITVDVYDAPYEMSVIMRNNEMPGQITLEQDILTTRTVDVRNGRFSVSLAVPVPMHESQAMNRVAFYADSDDGRRADAVLYPFNVIASAEEPDLNLGEAPSIDKFMILQANEDDDGINSADNINFIASGTVSQIGLNTAQSIGTESSLVIDGKTKIDQFSGAIKLNADNNWTINVEAPTLSVGSHTAVLSIADNAGRRVTRGLTFTVGQKKMQTLRSDVTTVRDKVTFDLETTDGDPGTYVLVIEDRHGNQIYHNDQVNFPFTVEMDKIGALTDGHYQVYARTYTEQGNHYTKRLPLTFVRKSE